MPYTYLLLEYLVAKGIAHQSIEHHPGDEICPYPRLTKSVLLPPNLWNLRCLCYTELV